MNTYGVIARFDTPLALVHAAEKVKDAGFKDFDCHSPFPIHGMDDAMGLKRSKLGYVIGAMGLTGALFGFGLQTWIHSIEYPMNISGKPFFAYLAYEDNQRVAKQVSLFPIILTAYLDSTILYFIQINFLELQAMHFMLVLKFQIQNITKKK